MRKWVLSIMVVCVATIGRAQAAPIYVDLGTASPPATLGSYSMTAFPDDPRALSTAFTSVPSPLGGDVGFSVPLQHSEIGSGWATWSNGYTGDVYGTGANGSFVTLLLPVGTQAFYFYAEPNLVGPFTFTVTASDGSPSIAFQPISGISGARGFGFYTTAGSLVSISVSGPTNFAIGEFGIANAQVTPVPEPATLALFALAGALAGLRRLSRQR